MGPGVYDSHSARVPGVETKQRLLERACEVIPAEHLILDAERAGGLLGARKRQTLKSTRAYR